MKKELFFIKFTSWIFKSRDEINVVDTHLNISEPFQSFLE